MCSISNIDWKSILLQTRQWKHLKRRKYIKKLKRSAKRKAIAVAAVSKSTACNNQDPVFNFVQENETIVKYYGFKPVYDCIVQETALMLLKKLVSLVCENELLSSNVSTTSVSLNQDSSTMQPTLPPEAVNVAAVASVTNTNKSLPNIQECDIRTSTTEKEDLIKNVETERFLEELDEEVKKWHNPFLPEHSQNRVVNVQPLEMNNSAVENSSYCQGSAANNPKQICHFYEKVGSCRFGDNCSRYHNAVDISDTLLLRGMFSTFAFDIVERAQKTSQGDFDDLWLEHTDADLYEEFVEFYNDVIPELETYGKVIQFKVCCNRDKHLLGNVYVQYKHEKDAKNASKHLNGRFYGGKPLSVKFVVIKSWKSAVCGLHYNNRDCPRGYHCNFLHVFKEPSRRFYEADIDSVAHKYKRRDFCYSERTTSRHSERSHRRETSHKRISLSPMHCRSPKPKRCKKPSKEHKIKHKKASKKHSRKHKYNKKDDHDSS